MREQYKGGWKETEIRKKLTTSFAAELLACDIRCRGKFLSLQTRSFEGEGCCCLIAANDEMFNTSQNRGTFTGASSGVCCVFYHVQFYDVVLLLFLPNGALSIKIYS